MGPLVPRFSGRAGPSQVGWGVQGVGVSFREQARTAAKPGGASQVSRGYQERSVPHGFSGCGPARALALGLGGQVPIFLKSHGGGGAEPLDPVGWSESVRGGLGQNRPGTEMTSMGATPAQTRGPPHVLRMQAPGSTAGVVC